MEAMAVGEPVAHGPMIMFPVYSSAEAPGDLPTQDEALVLDLIEANYILAGMSGSLALRGGVNCSRCIYESMRPVFLKALIARA